METISFYKSVTCDDNWYACQNSNNNSNQKPFDDCSILLFLFFLLFSLTLPCSICHHGKFPQWWSHNIYIYIYIYVCIYVCMYVCISLSLHRTFPKMIPAAVVLWQHGLPPSLSYCPFVRMGRHNDSAFVRLSPPSHLTYLHRMLHGGASI